MTDCQHDDDIEIIWNGSHPHSGYYAHCIDCGAIGAPDGPDGCGGESFDWCPHEHPTVETDNTGRDYIVCQDCEHQL